MSSPESRMDYETFQKLAPEATAALAALGVAVDRSGLEKELTELIKLRASQINGCAFCTQFHLGLARKNNVAAEKLDLVAVWHDAPVFTVRERAALEWTEQLTNPPRDGATDTAYAGVQAAFTTSEIAFLTTAIANINAWNRIAGGLRFTPIVPRRNA